MTHIRVLHLGAPFRGVLTVEEINCFSSWGASIVVNVYLFAPDEAIAIRQLFIKDARVSFASFDAGNSEALLQAIADGGVGYDVVICPTNISSITPEIIIAGQDSRLQHRLRAIGCANDSISHLEKIAHFASESGVPIIHTPGIHADSVAEYSIGQMVAHARRFRYFDDMTGRDGLWPHEEGVASTYLLNGKTLGVIGGSGKDGSAVIALAKRFGMDVIATSSGSVEGIRRLIHSGATIVGSVKELLSRSHFISINCRLCPDTQNMIGRGEIESIKKGTIVVNPSGAEIINKGALLAEFSKAVEDRVIAALILDMPYGGKRDRGAFVADPDNAKLKQLGVCFTPRTAGYTVDGQLKGVAQLAHQIRAYFQNGNSNLCIANSHGKVAAAQDHDEALLEDLIALVNQAANQALTLRREGLVIEYKPDGSPCTNADSRAESLIRDGLRLLGYEFSFCGEESQEVARDPGSMEVVIDGIDGTRNFRDGNYGWCISAAVRRNSETIIGVIYDPFGGEIFYARLGHGAFVLRDESVTRIAVPDVLPHDFSFSIGSFRVSGSTMIKMQISDDIKLLGGRGREWGCVALSICAVARGGLGTFIQGNSKYYDHIAALLIAREARASVLEKPKEDSSEIADIIVSHPSLHAAIKDIYDHRLRSAS